MLNPHIRLLSRDRGLVREIPELGIEAGSNPFSQLLGTQIILSRALCSFEAKRSLTSMSQAKQKRAVWLEAVSKSSFQDPTVFLKIHKDSAAVWTWDAAAIKARAKVSSRHLVPETLLHEPTEGFALRCAIDGFEGQFWQNGNIVLSRWWKDMPNQHQWKLFCLSGDTLGAHPVPLPEAEPGLLASSRHLPTNQLPASVMISTLGWKLGLVLLAMVIAIPTTYQLARLSYLDSRITIAEAELRALRSNKTDVRRLQSDTLLAADQIEPLVTFFRASHPLPAVADAMEQLKPLDADVTRLDYSAGILELTVTVPGDFTPTRLIRELEASANIREASIQPSRREGEWQLSASLEPDFAQGKLQ